jgi:hypothetical protein
LKEVPIEVPQKKRGRSERLRDSFEGPFRLIDLVSARAGFGLRQSKARKFSCVEEEQCGSLRQISQLDQDFLYEQTLLKVSGIWKFEQQNIQIG